MAATACCGQAVSLLDCVGARPRRERVGGGPLRCILRARPVALSELQHVKTHLRAAPECYNHPEIEEPIKFESNKARRRKKAAPALPQETQGNNDIVSSRTTKLNEASPAFSFVRNVVNAEDSSDKNRNGATSNDVSLRVSLKEKSGENSAALGQKALEPKSGKSTRHISKKNLAKGTVESTLDEQKERLNNDAGGIMIYTDSVTAAVNVMNTGGNRTSLEHTSASSCRKPRSQRRRKSEHDLFEQGCGQSPSGTGFSDSMTAHKEANGTGHTQEQYLADKHKNNEYAWLETHTGVGTKAVRLEYDVKLGENVVERSKYLDSLPSHSSSSSIAEESANEGNKLPGRKKKNRNVHLKQRVSKKIAKVEGLGNAGMSEVQSGIGKFANVSAKNTLTDQSSNLEDGLSEQHMTAKMSPNKLLSGASDVQTDRNVDAECVDIKFAKGLQNRAQAVFNLTVVDGSDSEGSLQEEGSRPLWNIRRSKRSRKQPSTEAINVEGEACKVSEPNQGMCTVQWLVETHLDENQKLFLVGENPHLGAWEPSMAVSFTLCEEAEKATLWQGHCQVPYGTHSEYNYFVRVGNEETDPRVWRPGPKLRLAIPPENSQGTKVIVKDYLDFDVANKLPSLPWEGLQNEIGFPTELRRFFGDEILFESLRQSKLVDLEGDSSKSISKQKEPLVMNVQNLSGEQKENCQHIIHEDDVNEDVMPRHLDDTAPLKKPQAEDNLSPIKLTPKLKKFIRRRVFPSEEPWLMESMILYEKGDMSKPPSAGIVEKGQEAEDSQDVVVEKISEKGEISTEILINSSKCTMERIAILEDGKLVELLLKPVNSDINVGNVYLGIVKKLLPGMTGVFVDIGHSRVALLTITKNMYPFTFPPIGSNENSLNGCVLDADGLSAGKQGIPFMELGQDLEKCDDLDDEDWETEGEDDEEDESSEVIDDAEELAGTDIQSDASHNGDLSEKMRNRKLLLANKRKTRPITVNFGQRFTKWRKVEEGMRIIVQVKREPLGKKGPKVSAFPQLSSRFWVLGMGGKSTGVSKKIDGPERRRLKDLANLYRKPGFDLTVRTEAAGQSQEDLEKDMMRLLETWKGILEQAEAASFAAQNGQDGAVPALLHRAMGQTLSIVRDFFAEKVQRMVVDSAQTYHEVTSYLQEVAPHLQNRVELYTGTSPIFDVFDLEDDIDKLLNERVQLANGAYLVIEETEALVTIDVNGGAGMLGKSMKSAAILEANLAAARQIAAELRLRDIGGIIVVDFIDMDEDEHELLVYEEMRNAIQSDRSIIYISEISELGLMELTRRRVRPSVTFMISDPCTCCRGTGRVEALETTFSKVERAILRLVANHPENIHFDGRTWKTVLLRVDPVMFEFLTRKQRAAQLSSSLKVYIILKVGREMTRGSFELSELKLESSSATTGQQQQRSLRKAVRLGAGGGRRDFASRL